jgi:hypothetical protein
MLQNTMRLGKKAFAALALIAVFFIGCKDRDTPPIPVEQMKAILFELQAAEAYSTMVPEDGVKDVNRKNQDTLAYYIAAVFQKYNLDQQRFTEALDWYLKRHEFSENLFASVIDSANVIKDKYAVSKAESEEMVEEETATEDADPASESESSQKPARFDKPLSRPDILDAETAPVDKEELEVIKQKSKAQQEALEKVRKEN